LIPIVGFCVKARSDQKQRENGKGKKSFHSWETDICNAL
jgi:hypothetical protein